MPASCRFEIFPSDLERCVAFYTDVLRFTTGRQKEGYAALYRGSVSIGAALRREESIQPGHRRPPTGVEIVIEVDDLEGEREFVVVKRGYSLDADIKMQDWVLKDFRLLDPDGYYLRFTSHSKEAKGDE